MSYENEKFITADKEGKDELYAEEGKINPEKAGEDFERGK